MRPAASLSLAPVVTDDTTRTHTLHVRAYGENTLHQPMAVEVGIGDTGEHRG